MFFTPYPALHLENGQPVSIRHNHTRTKSFPNFFYFPFIGDYNIIQGKVFPKALRGEVLKSDIVRRWMP
jgi:hypothetical protein